MARRTPLYGWHAAAGAKFLEFGGWDMPLQYRGIVEEHRAIRSAAGLFDVSHMGKLIVSGDGAAASLQLLSTNQLTKTPGRARYTHFLDSRGAILDDVIVTCLNRGRFLVVCNAGPRERIVAWVQDHLRGATLTDATESFLCLALQGPRAAGVLQRLTPADLTRVKAFGAAWVEFALPSPAAGRLPPAPEIEGWGPTVAAGHPIPWIPKTADRPPMAEGVALVTRTGYTGEDGFELFPPSTWAIDVWSALLDVGRAEGLLPAGLGARDTLRLEKGFLLSGQDFTGRETSLETGSERLIKWDHEFIGREALIAQRDHGEYRTLLGLRMLDRGIPRPGCAVIHGGREVGRVTSGTFSPSLRIGIALAYLDPESGVPGTRVELTIRGAEHPAEVVKPPFL